MTKQAVCKHDRAVRIHRIVAQPGEPSYVGWMAHICGDCDRARTAVVYLVEPSGRFAALYGRWTLHKSVNIAQAPALVLTRLPGESRSDFRERLEGVTCSESTRLDDGRCDVCRAVSYPGGAAGLPKDGDDPLADGWTTIVHPFASLAVPDECQVSLACPACTRSVRDCLGFMTAPRLGRRRCP